MILTFATDSAVHHPPSEPPLLPILRYNPWLGWGEGEEKKYLTGVKIRGSKSRTMVALSQSTCVLLHVSSTFFSSLSLNRQVLSSVAYFPQGQERRPAFSAMVRSSERLPPRLQNQVIQESLWGMILNCQSRAVSLFPFRQPLTARCFLFSPEHLCTEDSSFKLFAPAWMQFLIHYGQIRGRFLKSIYSLLSPRRYVFVLVLKDKEDHLRGLIISPPTPPPHYYNIIKVL